MRKEEGAIKKDNGIVLKESIVIRNWSRIISPVTMLVDEQSQERIRKLKAISRSFHTHSSCEQLELESGVRSLEFGDGTCHIERDTLYQCVWRYYTRLAALPVVHLSISPPKHPLATLQPLFVFHPFKHPSSHRDGDAFFPPTFKKHLSKF